MRPQNHGHYVRNAYWISHDNTLKLMHYYEDTIVFDFIEKQDVYDLQNDILKFMTKSSKHNVFFQINETIPKGLGSYVSNTVYFKVVGSKENITSYLLSEGYDEKDTLNIKSL